MKQDLPSTDLPAANLPDAALADAPPPNGTVEVVDGVRRVFYDGYWIKAYETPADTLRTKKQLIQALTRRLFNHVEHGINIPGKRLADARRAYETEQDPARKRVKGAMFAGALFNRATDIFTKMVEMQELGIEIETDNALMRECGFCLREALTLGRLVRHRSGEEGIDELWGEPFRAFSIPVDAFYESRYIKIAQTLREVDRVAAFMTATFAPVPMYAGIAAPIEAFRRIAALKCETLRTDPDVFDIWPEFVVASEQLADFHPQLTDDASPLEQQVAADGQRLVLQGRDLITFMTRARVPMPKSISEFFIRCEAFSARARQAEQARANGRSC